MAAEAALALVNIKVGQYYWLPWDTPRAVILMGVPWQPVVQPHLRVHHGQGRLGHAGGWISGNQGERQGAVRPTYVVKISCIVPRTCIVMNEAEDVFLLCDDDDTQ